MSSLDLSVACLWSSIAASTIIFKLFCRHADRRNRGRRGTDTRDVYTRDDSFNVYHPRSLAKTVPFPLIKLAFKADKSAYFDLIDTEALSSPVWSQADFRHPEWRWLLKPRIVYRAL